MKLLVASEIWPHPGHDALSANQVSFELMRALRDQTGCELSFVAAYWRERKPDAGAERRGQDALQALGAEVLEPIELPATGAGSGRWRRLLAPWLTDIYPELAYRGLAEEAVERSAADVLLVPWSEMPTRLFASARTFKVAYQGDADPLLRQVRQQAALAGVRGPKRRLVDALQAFHHQRAHLREMRRYQLFVDVAANHAAWYREHGVDSAFYVRMVYPDRGGSDWQSRRDALKRTAPAVITANIGSQSSTGNSLGLGYLAEQVLVPLSTRLSADAYEVHLFGGGSPPARVAAALRRPELVNRGFLEDIDTALLASAVFLCVNNATAYKASQSYFLLAWSLGCCVVAHRDSALSIPELVHRENALLGGDGEEIADLVSEAVGDPALRRRLGVNGYNCFRDEFGADDVARDLAARIAAGVSADAAGT